MTDFPNRVCTISPMIHMVM